MSKAKRGLGDMKSWDEKPLDAASAGRSLPKNYLSFSQISLYQSCAKAYEYRYILGETTSPVMAMALGKAVHKALEVNYEQKVTSHKDLPVKQVLDAFSTEYDEQVPLTSDVSSKDKGKIKDLAAKFVKKYQYVYAPHVIPVGVEEEFDVQLSETVRIKGFIDLIQEVDAPLPLTEESQLEKRAELESLPGAARKKVIVDHKVTTRKKAQHETNDSLQLSIYSMATGIPNVRYDALIATPSKMIEEDQRIVQTLSYRVPSEIDFYKSVILSMAEAISSGAFPKTGQGTWKCSDRFCPHFKQCHGL